MNDKINNSLFIRNRKNFAEKLSKNSMAVFCANEEMPRNGDQFYPYRQQSDFFYLTGIDRDCAYLIICPDHPNPAMREILFVEPYSESKVIWRGEMIDSKEASKISGVANVMYSDSFNTVLQDIAFSCSTIYLNTYEYPRYECKVVTIQQRFLEEMKDKFPLHKFERSAPILNKLRMIKSQEEIEVTQQACDITSKAFRRCLETVKPELNEYQVQAEIEYIFTLTTSS